MTETRKTREEACSAAAKIYAHWLATEGYAIRAKAERERDSA